MCHLNKLLLKEHTTNSSNLKIGADCQISPINFDLNGYERCYNFSCAWPIGYIHKRFWTEVHKDCQGTTTNKPEQRKSPDHGDFEENSRRKSSNARLQCTIRAAKRVPTLFISTVRAVPHEAQQKHSPKGSALPYLSGPELPSLQLVLQIVTDDVGFLQEEAHGVCQLRVLPDNRIF